MFPGVGKAVLLLAVWSFPYGVLACSNNTEGSYRCVSKRQGYFLERCEWDPVWHTRRNPDRSGMSGQLGGEYVWVAQDAWARANKETREECHKAAVALKEANCGR